MREGCYAWNRCSTQERKVKLQMGKRSKTPTFLLELPLVVGAGQAKRLRAHLEVARLFYNAVLSEGWRRLQRMREDPAWQAARAIPHAQKQARAAAFSTLREQYGFTEACLHAYARAARVSWLADHLDAVLAQTLASRAYHALNRVCLLWHEDRLPALIDWNDPVVKFGLAHRIKYARLIRRKASSPGAQGADAQGYRYSVQLALGGVPYRKPKHTVGTDTLGLDLGPSTIACVPREGEAHLQVCCEELTPPQQAIRRLQRKMERQRRAANPEHYDEKGRPKKRGKKGLVWKTSRGYLASRRRKATKERKLAAHRKSLQGRKVHDLIAVGHTIHTEKISYRGWQKRYGRSIGLRAPGMFMEILRRTVASTGGTMHEIPTRSTKLSQYCHGCGKTVRKPLWQRWHACACGIGPIQRDLYSADLPAYLDPADPIPSCARYVVPWEGAEARLRAAHERALQRANAGQDLPQSMGIPRAGARRPQSPTRLTQEPLFLLRRGRLEAWTEGSEPPRL